MKQSKKTLDVLVEPFRSDKGFDIGLILAFVVINSLVFVNAIFHDPRIGYDAIAHLEYIHAFSKLRLVTPEGSYEFFSPPLPYMFPALLIAITGMETLLAARLAQCFNILLSIGSTYYLIKTCQIVSRRSSLKLGTLVFLGILPVYYKTFAFVRGEPYVVFFAIVILYYTLLMVKKKRFTTTKAVILGTAMGLCALSRQWGFFLFPAVFVLLGGQWIRQPQQRSAITKTIGICLMLIAAISGWFYLSLYSRYGSSTAFNREPADQFSFNNQPPEFYFGISTKELFSSPVRPNFPNQFMPIFYSEIWGDYWCYFTIYAKNTMTSDYMNGYNLNQILARGGVPRWLETNYETASDYLGRVNRVSLYPSAVALAALVAAAIGILRRHGKDSSMISGQSDVYAFSLLAIILTMVGYFGFLIMYPSLGKGDTIKATYALQIFPFLAILVGILLARIKEQSHFLYWLILGGLGLSFVHNLAAMITNYRL